MGNIIRTVTLFTVILVVCTTSACLQDMEGRKNIDLFAQEDETQSQQDRSRSQADQSGSKEKNQDQQQGGEQGEQQDRDEQQNKGKQQNKSEQQDQAKAEERERTQPQQKKQSKTGGGGEQDSRQQKKAPPKLNTEKMERAKVTAFQVNGVREVFAVAIDDKVSVAVDVAQLRRFQLHSIRKEIFDRLQKAYPEDTIYVTTDRKIVWEMQKLEEQAFQNNDTAKMQKTQQKLNDDMKG